MKIIEKLRDILKEDDLKAFESELLKNISEQVEAKSKLLVEEKVKEIEAKADEFCEKQIAEGIEKGIAEKTKEIEDMTVEKLDQFLDAEISEKISDDTLKSIAINETYKPIIEGIKELFEEKYIDLDTEGHKILREAKEEIESSEEKLSAEIAEKMELKDQLDKTSAKLLIAEKISDLTETQKKRVYEFFSGKGLEETKEKLDAFIELVNEKNSDEEIVDSKVNEDVGAEDKKPSENKEKLEESEEKKFVSRANRLI